MPNRLNLDEFYGKFASEQMCRNYLEKARWGESIVCPKCNAAGKSYRYTSGKLYKCRACHKQFTALVGTIFEDSKLPLQKWFLAIYLATTLRHGVSSSQLSRYLGITQKTAWRMLSKLQYAIQHDNRKGMPEEGF
ncbi:MAG: transposase [Gammaproteobacteria bacterium]|nr:transposase [Gammaproteobacteria bacterium]